MLKNHHFNVEIAKHYGVFAAVILDQFIYWIDQNTASGTHIHNGKAWACASYETLCKIFPYFTKRQIEHAVDKLIEKGVIEVGFFAKNRFNRTRYFAFTDNFQSIVNSKNYTLLCDFPKPKNEDIEHIKNEDIEHRKNDTFDFTKMGNEISQNCEMDNTKMGNEISQNCEMLCTTSCTTECTTTECTTNLQHAKNGGCVNVENPDFELTANNKKRKITAKKSQVNTNPLPEKENQSDGKIDGLQDDFQLESETVLQPENEKPQKTANLPQNRQPECEVLTPIAMVWQAYKQAYYERYQAYPLRNAKVMGQIKQFIAQVGQDHAAAIAVFFVSHNNSWYVQKKHDIGTLLMNAQAVAVDWQKGTQTTRLAAQWEEQHAAAMGAAEEAKRIIRQMHELKH